MGKGSKITFLGTDKDGSEGGMISKIKENIPNKFISIEHLGEIQKGKEITDGNNDWAGAIENYTFTEEKGDTLLTVEMDSTKDFHPYFSETWPKALKKLKEISEV